MTCKDCISYEACKFNNKNLPEEYEPIEWQCDNFKNKSRYIELPYPLRTKVFVIRSQTSDKNNLYIFEDYITGYIYGKYGLLMTFDYHLSEDNFERVFTDKSKAEEKLKELENE